MNKTKTNSTTKTLNTYLVKYGQRLNFYCLDYIDCFRTNLVRAEDLDAAYSVALREHVPEGFKKEDGVLRGNWETFRTDSGAERPAFEFDDSWSEVDAGSLLWIENVVEVDPEDALTITRYLDALNNCK